MKRLRIISVILILCLALTGCAGDDALLGLDGGDGGQQQGGNANSQFTLGREDSGSTVTHTDQPQTAKTIEELAAEAGDAWDPKPIEYLSLDEIPENTYCIEHKKADGTYVYYLPYASYSSGFEVRDDAATYNPDRIVWVKSDLDEGFIPTMYSTDRIIYKSANAIPPRFAVERFYDGGYTIGVAKLQRAPSGNYLYVAGTTLLEPSSDTINLSMLGAEQIYIVSAGGKEIGDNNMSVAGYIMDLQKDTDYLCDVRTGTEKIDAIFRADIHVFFSYETYMENRFKFTTPQTVEIDHNQYMRTGYYTINNSGIIRYIAKGDEANYLRGEAIDYNTPYFLFDDETGNFISTVEGFKIYDGDDPNLVGTIVRDHPAAPVDEDYYYGEESVDIQDIIPDNSSESGESQNETEKSDGLK